MANTLFTNVNVFDGTSPVLYPAEVLVQGNRIKEVARGEGKQLQRDGVEEVDCGGATLMPGLINTHCHVTYTNAPGVPETCAVPIEAHGCCNYNY